MAVISGKQLLGRRENQEDAFDVVFQNERDPKSDILMLVTDGMGGHAGGEVAANLALSAFKKHFVEGSGAPRPRDRLQESLHAANDALRKRITSQPDLKGMGCTLIAALKLGDRLVWVSVGDSSLFLLRDGRLKKLNADHSLYGELLQMVATGSITQEDADNHPRRNALRSALMGEQISLIDVNAINLKPGDVVLACSDGLDTLSQPEITSVLKKGAGHDVRGVASDLLNAVEAKGKPKQDNTTVVVYVYVEEGMSSLLRGSQWAFGEGRKDNKKVLKYASIALGALAIGATVGALSWSGGDEPPATEDVPPSSTEPAPERDIEDPTVNEQPATPLPGDGDAEVTEPGTEDTEADTGAAPDAPAEDPPATTEPDDAAPPDPETVPDADQEPPSESLEDER